MRIQICSFLVYFLLVLYERDGAIYMRLPHMLMCTGVSQGPRLLQVTESVSTLINPINSYLKKMNSINLFKITSKARIDTIVYPCEV
jgi:hypothetical protein